MKICSHCGENLPLKYFYKDSSNSDGFQNRCKECTKEFNKKNVLKNKTDRPFLVKTKKIPKSSNPEYQWNKRHYKAYEILIKKARKQTSSHFPSFEEAMELILEDSPDIFNTISQRSDFSNFYSKFCSNLCVVWTSENNQFMVSYLEP